MYKIIWKPVKYINYIINNGLVLYPGQKENDEGRADCASPGGHTGDLHQGRHSGRVSYLSVLMWNCLVFLFFLSFLVTVPKTVWQSESEANCYG